MTRSNTKKYNIYCSGYYDDFSSSRAIADDENSPTVDLAYDHEKTHYGNALNGEARLNPRYKKSWKKRDGGDKTHNTGAHNFLSNDVIRDDNEKWEGKAQVSYPDGIAQTNRVPFNNDTVSHDSYMLLSNGFNTSGLYSIYLGESDATDGEANLNDIGSIGTGLTPGNYTAGSDAYLGILSQPNFEVHQYAHLTGCHAGEVSPRGDSRDGTITSGIPSDPFASGILENIESLSGNPFLAIHTHLRTQDNIDSSSIRLISYNANLGAGTDEDVFGIRMAWRGTSSISQSVYNTIDACSPELKYTIQVGFDKTTYTENGGFTGTPAAEFTFHSGYRGRTTGFALDSNTAGTNLKTGFVDKHPWNKYTENNSTSESTNPSIPGSNEALDSPDQNRTYPLTTIWNDFEFAFDFTNGTYIVLHDGEVVKSTTAIGTNPATSAQYTADEIHGWQMNLVVDDRNNGSSSGVRTATKVATLIDRAYLWRDLSQLDTAITENATLGYNSNGISSFAVNIFDDDNSLSLYPLFEKETNQLQELMMFYDGLDRCVWRGHLENITIKQSMPSEKLITLTARDYLGALDRVLPIWEIGQSSKIDDDEPVGWRPYESTNFIEKMNFGATKFERGNATLGYIAPNFKERIDSRMRLNSAHPIQIYNEEGGAPDRIWDIGSTILEIQGFKRALPTYANPYSLTNPLQVISKAHGFVHGESVTISGTTNYDGTYTVNDPSTDYYYIDKTYTQTGLIAQLHTNKGMTVRTNRLQDYAVSNFIIDFDSAYPNKEYTTIVLSDNRKRAGTNGGNGGYRTDSFTYTASGGSTTTHDFNTDPVITLLPHTLTNYANKRYNTDATGCRVSLGTSSSKSTAVAVLDQPSYQYGTGRVTWDDYGAGYLDDEHWNATTPSANDLWTWVGGSPTTTPITYINFTNGEMSRYLYAGAKIQLWISKDPTTVAFASSPDATYTITSVGSHTSSLSWKTYISFDSGTPITEIAASTGTVRKWRIIDEKIPFCSETGKSTNSAANLSSASTNFFLRNLHARWIQDLPKSLWFQKTFGVIEKNAVSTSTLSSAVSPTSFSGSGQTINLTSSLGFTATAEVIALASSGGVGEIVNTDGSVDSFTFSGLASLVSGRYQQMTGVKFLTQNHASGKTVKLRSISNDYKHCWVLWADMRNGGLADADGGKRKNKFGLRFPLQDNYNISMEYIDQENVDGEPIELSSLTVGQDLDIWELDAEVEPHSRNTWSSLGSDLETNTNFHNWESKAGAFIVIDTSKFWNLNTEANAGKTGQRGGGRTSIGDYVAVNNGVPQMMDNYWVEGMASYKNAASPVAFHPDQLEFIHDPSLLVSNYPATGASSNSSGNILKLEDTSQWNEYGVGRIVAENNVSGQNYINTWYYSWRGKDDTTNELFNVYVTRLSAANLQNSSYLTTLKTNLWNTAVGSPQRFTGAGSAIKLSDFTESQVTAYNTLSPLNNMRFMMRISGFIDNPNSGTAYEHDKIRFLNMSALTKHWLGKSQQTGISDIQNVPISSNMITKNTWSYYSGFFTDEFLSSADVRGKTYFGALQTMKSTAGQGSNNNIATYSYQIGADARIEFRPGYSSFHNFTRNNLNVSNFKSTVQTQTTNVRLYYNNQKSFIDYPTTVSDENIRWSILDMPNVSTHTEALHIAKAHYEKAKSSIISMEAKLIKGEGEDSMLTGGRYGYISDQSRCAMGNGHWWVSRQGGTIFPGMVNAMDGNLTATGTATRGSSDTPASFPATWSNWGGYFYGANSIANAIQIVHLPKYFPKYSNTTGNQLRFVILVDGFEGAAPINWAQALEKIKFRLQIIDPEFQNDSGRTSDDTPSMSLFSQGGTQWYKDTLDLENGFREVLIPPQYWNDATAPVSDAEKRIVISVNKDYLKALVAHRCGDDYSLVGDNAHSIATYNEATPNTDSIFPLGARKYTEYRGYGDERYMWYAPKLVVANDINYRVSTALTYSDAVYGFTNKPLIINRLTWNIKNLGDDEVYLGLTTDESTFLPSITAITQRKGPQIPASPPSSSPGGTRGRGGGGRSQPDDDAPEQAEQGDDYVPIGPPSKAPAGTVGNQYQNLAAQFYGAGVVNTNFFSQGLNNKLNNVMNLPSGVFSLLGQTRPTPISIGTSTYSSQDVLRTTSGNAVLSDGSYSFPGVFTDDETQQPEMSEYKIQNVVPAGAVSDNISIFATASIISPAVESDSTQQIQLNVKVKCLETGTEEEQDVIIPSSIEDNTSVAIFEGSVAGLGIAGNSFEITMSRLPNAEQDDAPYRTLKLNSIRPQILSMNLPADSLQNTFGF